ncbi:MAG: methyltransferase domain-containing protein [Pontimonas sp.]
MFASKAPFGAYRAPDSLEMLEFEAEADSLHGILRSSSGRTYPVVAGIPNFVTRQNLSDSDLASLDWYHHNAITYDEYLPLTFRTLKVDESSEREKIIAELQLGPGLRVLETGCGSGRDSLRIANEMGEGELYLQDISEDILRFAVENFQDAAGGPSVHFAVANGYELPFPENYFDRTFHFGGLNTFGDKTRALLEMARVTKPGGIVLVGDESIPTWMRDTDFARILMNSNPHFSYTVPLESIPQCASNLKLQWIMGDAFYLISFQKRDGDPSGDFDFEIPGWRGGTHRKRYFGQLEGVSPHIKAAVIARAKKEGASVSAWLEKSLLPLVEDEI